MEDIPLSINHKFNWGIKGMMTICMIEQTSLHFLPIRNNRAPRVSLSFSLKHQHWKPKTILPSQLRQEQEEMNKNFLFFLCPRKEKDLSLRSIFFCFWRHTNKYFTVNITRMRRNSNRAQPLVHGNKRNGTYCVLFSCYPVNPVQRQTWAFSQ